MATYDDYDSDTQTRQRQAADLEYIARYYDLENRAGIQVRIGGRIRNGGREGTITDTAGQYLIVQHDGDDQPVTCHVTANKAYQTHRGWIEAAPVPDPWAVS
ncbi:hypothetical protein OHS71_41205 (plasmid) [Streptomyces sp. NBC_00377]|uniref:hypothetical protein n=1 Tax=unclassified Streptomyces TaxID=2593676 RepID=UPI002E24B206|nr:MULTISPECIES: hypothetical protein [unclassified Streptomyces]